MSGAVGDIKVKHEQTKRNKSQVQNLRVVDSVQSHLLSHVLNSASWHRLQGLQIPDLCNKSMHSLSLPVDDELGENDAVVRVARSVRDPVLLRKHGRRVDDEGIVLGIVSGGGLHLDGVVAITELREPEAADDLGRIGLVREELALLGRTETVDGTFWF